VPLSKWKQDFDAISGSTRSNQLLSPLHRINITVDNYSPFGEGSEQLVLTPAANGELAHGTCQKRHESHDIPHLEVGRTTHCLKINTSFFSILAMFAFGPRRAAFGGVGSTLVRNVIAQFGVIF
jgi:hypothetical protein